MAWYKEKEPHDEIFRTASDIDENQSNRYEENLDNIRFYSSRLVSGLYGADYAVQDNGAKLKVNVIQAVVDAAVAHLATNKPRPLFLTEGGDYSNKRKAKGLTKFVDGVFYATDQYATSLDVFRDGGVFGTGVCKIYAGRNEVVSERVFPDSIVVDDVEGRMRNPRNLYEYREVAREVLADEFPKFKNEIESAEWTGKGDDGAGAFVRLGRLSEKNDPVSVYEAWHLPSGPEAKDGRHVIATSNATLVNESWERQDFPFAFWRWKPAVLGFYGQGIVEELKSIQIEINYLLQKIQRSMNLASSQLWVAEGTRVSQQRVTNRDWSINKYSGQPPVVLNSNPIADQYFIQVDRLYQRAFEQVGISQLAAQSQKPTGLSSGEALRVFNDIGSKRFQEVLQRWENFHLEVSSKMIHAARELDERIAGGYKILAKDARIVQEIKWKDVSLQDDKFVMQVFPTSFLPDTPAGKIETLRELAEVSPELAQGLVRELNFPDVEGQVALLNAPVDMIDLLTERMIEEGEYRPPTPFLNLALAVQRVSQALVKAEIDGVAEERLELLRRFVTEAQALFAQATQPPPQQLEAGPQPGPQQQLPPELAGALPQ